MFGKLLASSLMKVLRQKGQVMEPSLQISCVQIKKLLACNVLQSSKNKAKYLEALQANSVRALKEFRFLVFRVELDETDTASDQIVDLVIVSTCHLSLIVSVYKIPLIWDGKIKETTSIVDWN